MPAESPLELVRAQMEILRPGQGGDMDVSLLLGRDLHMSSIELARLAGGLRRALGGEPLPFQLLFAPGEDVKDLTVGRLVAFLEEHVPS